MSLFRSGRVCTVLGGDGERRREQVKRIINTANVYVQESDWKDFALVKLCLCSVGLMIGAALPKKAKKPVIFGAMAVFVATYVPLITKFMRILATMPKPVEKPDRRRPLRRMDEESAGPADDWDEDWE